MWEYPTRIVLLARASPRKARSSCAGDDERTSAWEGRSVHHGLSVLRLTEGKRSAPEGSIARRRRASRWASRCRSHLGRRSLGPFTRPQRRESLRVRQLVARGLRSRRARGNAGGGRKEGEAARTRSPLEAPSNAISAQWIAQ